VFRHLQRDFMHNRHDHGLSRHGEDGATHLFIAPRNATLPNVGQPWQKRATSAPSRRATLGIAPQLGSALRNAMLPVAMGGPEP